MATRLVDGAQAPWRTIDRVDDLPIPPELAGAARPLVVAHAGAAHGDAKRWREEHWERSLAAIGVERRDHRIRRPSPATARWRGGCKRQSLV